MELRGSSYIKEIGERGNAGAGWIGREVKASEWIICSLLRITRRITHSQDTKYVEMLLYSCVKEMRWCFDWKKYECQWLDYLPVRTVKNLQYIHTLTDKKTRHTRNYNTPLFSFSSFSCFPFLFFVSFPFSNNLFHDFFGFLSLYLLSTFLPSLCIYSFLYTCLVPESHLTVPRHLASRFALVSSALLFSSSFFSSALYSLLFSHHLKWVLVHWKTKVFPNVLNFSLVLVCFILFWLML